MTTATLANQNTAAVDPTFQAKCLAAACQTAITIRTEDPTTANHTARIALGSRLLNNPSAHGASIAAVASAIALVDSSSTDAAILAAVAGGWDTLAGGV